MSEETYKRKLTAIFSTDVKDYSRLMGEDELATVEILKEYHQVITEYINRYQGRVIDSPGDNLLAEFASVVNAVECALAVQREIKDRNKEVPEKRRMEFRIGVNLGDVIQDKDRIYGDGVNIAARLEGLANAGEVWISSMAYDQVKGKIAVGFEYQGRQQVKNIPDSIRVYRLLTDPDKSGATIYRRRKDDPRHRAWMAVVVISVMVISIVAAVFGFKLYFHGSDGPIKKAIIAHRMRANLKGIPSIAVLPFVNISEDAEQEYFADGFTEDLITDLSKISGLRVISRNSVFVYKGKSVNIKEVGKEFGVGYVLEGSVRKIGDQVRINAQLIDVKTINHVWAERYDRDLKDIFNLQDEVSQKIVSALALKLTKGEETRIFKKATKNMDAYDVCLRGKEYYSRFTKPFNEKARELFKRAIKIDPRFAEAHAALGWTYVTDWSMGWTNDLEYLEQAYELAGIALSLDENAHKALCLMGYVLLWKKKHDESIEAYEKSLALNPNYAEALSGMGDTLAWAGRPKQGIPLIEEAISLNPNQAEYYQFNLGHAFYLTHRYNQAIEAFQKSLNQNPDFFPSRIYLAAVYSEIDQIGFAKDEMDEVLKRITIDSFDKLSQKLPYRDPKMLKRVLDAIKKVVDK
ncbi:MAG: tetratricopeptide repeat protein [Deltaproteobacteria bacterium]|nr:tetratricopeptide repeat protein [Deltaproteobacteria bacterium]